MKRYVGQKRSEGWKRPMRRYRQTGKPYPIWVELFLPRHGNIPASVETIDLASDYGQLRWKTLRWAYTAKL